MRSFTTIKSFSKNLEQEYTFDEMKWLTYLFYFLLLGNIFLWRNANAQDCGVSLETISYAQGLENTYINDISKDENGFIWFAGDDGISRYDGVSFFNLPEQAKDTVFSKFLPVKQLKSLNNNSLLLVSKRGDVGIYNLKERELKPVTRLKNQQGVAQMVVSAQTAIFSLSGGGLVELNIDNKTENTLLPELKINKLYKDHLGIIWLCTDKGLYLRRNKLSYQLVAGTENINIQAIAEDGKGNFWVLSEKSIFSLDSRLRLTTMNIKDHLPLVSIRHMMHSGTLLLLIDEFGQLWTLADNERVTHCPFSDMTSLTEPLSEVWLDESGICWMGTKGNGVLYFNIHTVSSAFFSLPDPKRSSYNVLAIDADSLGNVWSLDKSFLLNFDNKGKIINRVKYTDLFNDFIRPENFKVHNNKLWLNTANKGLWIINLVKNKKENQYDKTQLFPDEFIESIAFVNNNKLLVSSNKGVYRVDRQSNAIDLLDANLRGCKIQSSPKKILLYNQNGIYTFSTNKLETICSINTSSALGLNIVGMVIKNNTVYVASEKNGLLKGKIANGEVTLEKLNLGQNALPGKVVLALNEWGDNKLLITTRSGLGIYDLATLELRKYYRTDGMLSDEINFTPVKDTETTWYFATIRGVIGVENGISLPTGERFQVFVTGLSVPFLNKDIKEPVFISSFEIPYGNRSFTLHLAVPDYLHTNKINYFYNLKGGGNEWVSLGNSNRLNFSNLNQGNYLLQLKASSGNGLSSPVKTYNLIIKPPFYESNLFKIIVLIILVLLVGLGYWVKLERARRRSIALEAVIDRRTAELRIQNQELQLAKDAAQQSDRAKSEFMATVSHEIRTPMNGIMAATSMLSLTDLDEEQRQNVTTIAESGDNMLAIINEILDFSNIESGTLKAIYGQFDFYTTIEVLTQNFKIRAYKANLDFSYYISPSVPKEVETDKGRLIQILTNLLANAIKFTKEGFVHLHISGNSEMLDIKVVDTGVGIDSEKLELIFKPFTQGDSSSTRAFGGTGLGLAICKSMVTLLDGHISVTSQVGMGSIFKVKLPLKSATPAPQLPILPANNQYIILAKASKSVEVLQQMLKEMGVKSTVVSTLPDLASLGSTTFDILLIEADYLEDSNSAMLESIAHRIIVINRKAQPLKLSELYDAEKFGVIDAPVGREKLYSTIINKRISPSSSEFNSQTSNLPKTTLKVLLAEDNKVNQMVTKKLFKKLGYEITIAENGKIAVDLQEREAYDVILMDLLMPEMDGEMATSLIRQQFSNGQSPYIIAFSANVYNRTKEEYKKLGFNNVLSKPAKIEQIADLMQGLESKLGQVVRH